MFRTRLITLNVIALVATAGCSRTPIAPTSTVVSGTGSAQTAAKGGKPPASQSAMAAFRCPSPSCPGTDRVLGDGFGAYEGTINQ